MYNGWCDQIKSEQSQIFFIADGSMWLIPVSSIWRKEQIWNTFARIHKPRIYGYQLKCCLLIIYIYVRVAENTSITEERVLGLSLIEIHKYY